MILLPSLCLCLQASWHPHSPSHFAVLASDARLRLYHLNDLSEPEQSFHLRLQGSGQPSTSSMGLGLSGLGKRTVRPTAFAWGPPVGWGKLAVLVLAGDGGVYSLCPVAPFGVMCSAGTLRGQLESAQGGWQWLRWVCCLFFLAGWVKLASDDGDIVLMPMMPFGTMCMQCHPLQHMRKYTVHGNLCTTALLVSCTCR